MALRLLFGALLCALSWAQDTSAPVLIDGKEVVRIYGPLGSFAAKDRALAIEGRIIALAKKGFTGKLGIRAIPAEQATAVLAGPVIVMGVTDADAEAAGVPREELARKSAAAIQQAIERYRADHTLRSLVLAIGQAVVVWTVFWFTAWVFLKSTRWLGARSESRLQRFFSDRELRGFHTLVWERARSVVMALVRVAIAILLLSEFSFALSFTFGLFPQTAGISTTLMDYLEGAFSGVGVAIIGYLPSGAFVLIVCVFTRFVIKGLKFWADAVERGDITVRNLHPEMVKPTYQLLRFVVIVFALVIAFPYLPGGQSEAFKGVSIFLGVLLSLGSSSAVSNVLAGLVLTYMRPFHAGDRVKIADTVGDVLEKNLLVTRLRTIKNVEVVIPNSAILGTQILNYSAQARTKGLILHTTVTIGYDAPWRTVHELLIHASLNTEGVLKEPRPFVLETSLNDFHISYELNAYTDRPNDIQNIYSGMHEAIQDSFNKAGVEIMSPTFYALRDGNTVTIPASDRPPDYEAPSFRVKDTAPQGAAVAQNGSRT